MNMRHYDIRPTSKRAPVVSVDVATKAIRNTPKDLVYTVLLAGVTIGVVLASSWFVGHDPFGTDEREQEILTELASREIIVSEVRGEGRDAVVFYAYKGEPIVGKLKEGEVLELRTDSSFTESLGQDETGKGIYTTISFARPSYLREPNGWRYIEYGQAPKRLFDRAKGQGVLGWRLIPTAIAASTIYAGSGDGAINNFGLTWADSYSATTGVAVSGGTTVSVGTSVTTGKVSGATIMRVFLPFVTSTIPSGATITAASLNVYATSTTSYPGDAYDYITVVRTSQATHTTLADADYDNIVSTEGIDSGSRKEISTISLGSYVTFPLNATGRGWIAKSGVASNCSATAGITCLGLRDGHDVQNVAPADNTQSSADFSASESTGTSQDPYLSVTYSAGFAFWQFDIF